MSSYEQRVQFQRADYQVTLTLTVTVPHDNEQLPRGLGSESMTGVSGAVVSNVLAALPDCRVRVGSLKIRRV